MLSLTNVSLKNRVKNVTLSLQKNELVVLLGPNGAGKSSVLSLLSGLEKPDVGEALLDGEPLSYFSAKQLAKRRAVLEQRPVLPSGFKVSAIVEMGAYRHGEKDAIDQAVSLIRIQDLMSRNSETLSGGEIQRVLLARALVQLLTQATEERYLLLDEPTASLDIGVADAVLTLIRDIVRQFDIAVLVVLHDLNLALRHADKVGLMAHSTLHVLGHTAEVMHLKKLEALYDTSLAQLIDNAKPPNKAFIALGKPSIKAS
ncbi:MAG: ABC transporter ATP-binding protein [Neisseriales bacterium]|nr:MAG: ABC transporter ATP-binding protein [Neisseriales bacterium]